MLEPVRDDDAPDWAANFWDVKASPEDGQDTLPSPQPSLVEADLPAGAEPWPHRSRGTRARLRIALGAVLILAGIAVALVPRIRWHRTLAPVRQALSAASATGLVYPEARPPVTGAAPPATESGGLPAGFQASMDRLRARFDRAPRDPEVAYWLGAGYTVSGQLEKARAAVDIGRVHNTHEPRLWILDAILAAREGDARAARDILERFLASYPGNTLAEKDLQALDQVPAPSVSLR